MRAGAVVVVIAVLAAPVRADSFDPRDLDKQAHMAVSYGITLSGSVILRRYRVPRWQAVAIAAATALALGTFKELVLDEPYSWGDQLGNTIGAGTAAAIVFSFRL